MLLAWVLRRDFVHPGVLHLVVLRPGVFRSEVLHHAWCLRFIGVMSRGLTRVLRLMGLTASGLIFWGSYATFLDRRFTYPGVLQPGILISRGVN